MSSSFVDVEMLSDDDDWDPIQLNYEQYPNSLGNSTDDKYSGIIEINDSDTDSNLTPSKKITTIVKVGSTLPESFFYNYRNIDLLKQCCPLKIELVDCSKYPWYYKNINHIDSISLNNSQSEELTCEGVGENFPFKKMPLKATKLKPKIRPVDISTYLKSNIKRSLPKKSFTKKINKSSIDFKNNQGLVGLKISCPKSVEAVLKSFTDSIINSKESHFKMCEKNKTKNPEIIEKKCIDYKPVKKNIEKFLKLNYDNSENTNKHETLNKQRKNMQCKKIKETLFNEDNSNIKECMNDAISPNINEKNIKFEIKDNIMYDDADKLLTQNVMMDSDTKKGTKNTSVDQENKCNKLIIGTKADCDNNVLKPVKKTSFSQRKTKLKRPLKQDINKSQKESSENRSRKNLNTGVGLKIIVDNLLHEQYQVSTNILLDKEQKTSNANIAPVKNKSKQEVPISISDPKQNFIKPTVNTKTLSDGYKIPQTNQNLTICTIKSTQVSQNNVHSQPREPVVSKTKNISSLVSGKDNVNNKDKYQNLTISTINAKQVSPNNVHSQSREPVVSKTKNISLLVSGKDNVSNKYFNLNANIQSVFTVPVNYQSNVSLNLLSKQQTCQQISTLHTNKPHSLVKDKSNTVSELNCPVQKRGQPIETYITNRGLHPKELQTIPPFDNQNVSSNKIFFKNIRFVPTDSKNIPCVNKTELRNTIPNNQYLNKSQNVNQPVYNNNIHPSKYPVIQSMLNNVPNTFYYGQLNQNILPEIKTDFAFPPPLTPPPPPLPPFPSLPTPPSTSLTSLPATCLPLKCSTSTIPYQSSSFQLPTSISTSLPGPLSHCFSNILQSKPPPTFYLPPPTPLCTSATLKSSTSLPLQYSTPTSYLPSAHSLCTALSTSSSAPFLTISQSAFHLSNPPSISAPMIPMLPSTSSTPLKILEGTKIIGHNSNGVIRTIAFPPSAIKRNTNNLSPKIILNNKQPNAGYSPPILPIRTYEEYFEMLAETGQSSTQNDLRKNKIEKPNEDNTVLETVKDVYDRKRKISCMESNTDMSAMKISLNDYKKKLLSDYLDDVKVKIEPESILCIKKSSDIDLGYNSDSNGKVI